ncbi:MAG: T9SS type A sorting domain-containing protein [Bacteroidia bacterium]
MFKFNIVIINLFVLFCQLSSAQNPVWGWGPPITTSLNGTTLNCTTYDPILNTTKTYNIYNVANFINSDGVVAWVTSGSTVGGLIYDINEGAWKQTTFSSNTGNTIQNSSGVIAWVSSAGTVGGAVYDPNQKVWKYTTFSSNTGNSIINEEGVIAWVSSAGTVGGAIYDPAQQVWKYTTFSSNTGNSILNSEGIIAWISSSGTVGGAVYDPDQQVWKYTSFSSGSSNANLSIINGTVFWNSASGVQKYGYNVNSKSWSNNYNTDLYCKLFASEISGNKPLITYLWCLSIGANSYSYSCGDGHTINRRWAFKQYNNPGNYNVTLSIFNSQFNNTCNKSIVVYDPLDIAEINNVNVKIYPNPVERNKILFVNAAVPLTQIKLMSLSGTVTVDWLINNNSNEIILPDVTAGIYFLECTLKDKSKTINKIVIY